jgi:transcriptional regulator with XRE-family HTH domain
MTNEAVEPGWIPTDATFGARLALIRQHRGWTNVKEAALACGVPVESWRGWEQGVAPREYLKACRTIADRSGSDYDWLLDARRPSNWGEVTREYLGLLSVNRPAASTNLAIVPEPAQVAA